MHFIALWGWFSCSVLSVTFCEYGPFSIATVHFSKFSIATNVLLNQIPFYPVKQGFRFSWQLFICVPWQPVHSNSAISLATMKWANNCHFKTLKFIFLWIRHKKSNQKACYNRIWSWSPVLCEKPGLWASVTTKTSTFSLVFCLLSPSDHVFHKAQETMIKSYNMQNVWSAQ